MISDALKCCIVLAFASVASAQIASPVLPSTPQAVTIPRSSVESLTAIDGTSYQIYVGLPRSYEQNKQRYHVIFVLDAEYSFAIVRNIIEHLSDRNDLPELIVVGVTYPGGIEGNGWLRRYRTQRTRDYTPTYSKIGYPDGVQDVSGGGKKFLEFIETKLVPFIDQRFRTIASDRTIIGHSYGGLFAGYATLTKPELISRAIMVSPSLWYDNHFLFHYEQSRPQDLKARPIRVFLAAGSRENVQSDGNIAGDIKKFAESLKTSNYKAAQVGSVVFQGETHNSVFPAAVSRGLLEFFGAERKEKEASK